HFFLLSFSMDSFPNIHLEKSEFSSENCISSSLPQEATSPHDQGQVEDQTHSSSIDPDILSFNSLKEAVSTFFHLNDLTKAIIIDDPSAFPSDPSPNIKYILIQKLPKFSKNHSKFPTPSMIIGKSCDFCFKVYCFPHFVRIVFLSFFSLFSFLFQLDFSAAVTEAKWQTCRWRKM